MRSWNNKRCDILVPTVIHERQNSDLAPAPTTNRDGFVVLVVAIALTWWFEETPSELVWGYWISGFVLPFIFFLADAVGSIRREEIGAGTFLKGFIAFCFFAWFMVFVYDVYGAILNAAYPLTPDPQRTYLGILTWRNPRHFELWPTVGVAIEKYFWVILLTVASLGADLGRLIRGEADDGEESGSFGSANIRVHLIVMLAVGLQILLAGLSVHAPVTDSVLVGIVFQIVYFYPLRRRKNEH